MPSPVFKSIPPLLVAATCLGAAHASAESGHLWETRMEMSGGGFAGTLPPQTRNICLPQKQPEAPGMDSKECRLLESSKSGNRARWRASCKDGSTVSGDFTYQGDSAYRGTVSYRGSEGNVQMKIAGKHLGACDLDTPKAAPRGTSGACDQAVAALNAALFFGSGATCKEKRPEFCRRLNNLSPEEYARVHQEMDAGREMQAHLKGSGIATMEDGIKGCGLRPETLAARACGKAVRQKEYDFVGKLCPAEARQLSQKYCEGRDYTALRQSPDWEICYALGIDPRPGGRQPSSGRGATANPMDGNAADLIQGGVNQLKGLFGL